MHAFVFVLVLVLVCYLGLDRQLTSGHTTADGHASELQPFKWLGVTTKQTTKQTDRQQQQQDRQHGDGGPGIITWLNPIVCVWHTIERARSRDHERVKSVSH